MSIIQLTFESGFEPPHVITTWWTKVSTQSGLSMPNPLSTGECSTCGGYWDNLWVNLELWEKPNAGTTVARLSARAEPFSETQVRRTLQELIRELQPPPPRMTPAEAFRPDSFTYMANWEWTTEDENALGRTSARLAAIIDATPRGLCGADGTLLADASAGCKWGFIDAPRRAAYLDYPGPPNIDGVYTLRLTEGCVPVPISSVPGTKIVKTKTEPYSAAVSPDGRMLGLLEYNAALGYGRSYLSLVDIATASERRLSWFAGASGGEQISFSPDGRWILIGSRSHGGPIIVDVATGAQCELPDITNTNCWWVGNGHLGLLEFGTGNWDSPEFDPSRVIFHDLATGGTADLPRLRTPVYGMERRWEVVSLAVAHADGRVLLQHYGLPPNDNYTVSARLSVVDLRTGEFSLVMEPFADPDRFIRRDLSNWSWNSPLALEVTARSALIEQGLGQVDTSAWPTSEDRYGAVLRVEMDSPFFTGSV